MKSFLAVFTLVAIALTTGTAAEKKEKAPDPVAEMAAKLQPTRLVTYKKVGDRELKLYVFEPEGFKPSDRRGCFITIHGTGDTVTPFKGAQLFHDAMLKAGNRSELVVNEGGRHGYLMFDRALYDETLRKTEVFLTSLGMLKRQ
jgi:hypothetical protein